MTASARPTRAVLALISLTAAVRVLFALSVGLGVDESYMVSAGRIPSLGYFDHPPIAWWLARGAAWLFGSEAAIVVRLPFIAVFALTTWLMYRLGTEARGERAGFWAAAALNVSPVFGITSASWVLPDGPLNCALIAAALCLIRAIRRPTREVGWWIMTGIGAGVALASKYSAVLSIGGALLFLLISPPHRVWLRRVGPWLAGLVAVAVFSPVIFWNATHGWASFAFQGNRALGSEFRLVASLEVLGGGALFLLPWLWAVMAPLGARALWRGDDTSRLLACLGMPPILVFALIAAWSSQGVLFHWAAPGYLMLFPLLGTWVADRIGHAWMRWTIGATVTLVLIVVTVIGAQTRFDVFGDRLSAIMREDPTIEGVDWTSLGDDLRARGLLPSGMIVGVPNWSDAGKIARGLGPSVPVVVLNQDARQFGLTAPASEAVGHDMLVLSLDPLAPDLAGAFANLQPLPASAIRLRGRRVRTIGLYRGRLISWP